MAIVTGGATGVGRATALELARRGCTVVIGYSQSRDDAQATAATIRTMDVGAITCQVDVADDAACRAMVARADREFGRVDVLIQSAATTTFIDAKNLDGVNDEHWERIFAVNLKGPFQCARAVRAVMERTGGGAIVNVSSVGGGRGIGSSIPYTTSKAALDSLTAILAQVLAPAIRVNAVAPGFITGRWLQRGLGDGYEPLKRRIERRAPLQAVCEPADVASAIVALVCGSDMVTGQVLTVDGGLSVLL